MSYDISHLTLQQVPVPRITGISPDVDLVITVYILHACLIVVCIFACECERVVIETWQALRSKMLSGLEGLRV